MKLKYILRFLLFSLGYLAFGFTLTYTLTTTTGDQSTVHWDITDSSGFLKMIRTDQDGKRYFFSEYNGSIQWTIYRDNQNKIFFSGNKNADAIEVSNFYHKKRHNKTIRTENIYWFQPMGISFFNFVISEERYREFVFINPENLRPLFMTIRKKNYETITIQNERKNVIRAELRLNGILSPFWCGTYWLCRKTGVILRYKGTFGPGTRETIMELTETTGQINTVNGFKQPIVFLQSDYR